MKRMFNVKSIRVEKHIIKLINNDENISFVEDEKYILNCESEKQYYEIILFYDYSESKMKKAKIEIKKVKRFTGISYFVNGNVSIEIDDSIKKFNNDIFCFCENEIIIKYENLKETIRLQDKRLVWIFIGDSCLGKSYLASTLSNNSNLTVYETDCCKELPANITEDIVVVGGKYKFDIDDIKRRIYGNYKSIIVNFEEK